MPRLSVGSTLAIDWWHQDSLTSTRMRAMAWRVKGWPTRSRYWRRGLPPSLQILTVGGRSTWTNSVRCLRPMGSG